MASECSAHSPQSTEPSPEQRGEPVPNRVTENLSSHAPISSEDPGLGKLSRLPREIRDQIWREFLPKNHNESLTVQHTGSPNTRLAVLRTSARIYHEVGSQIYPTGRKPFIICVTPEYKSGSWITLSNGKKNPTIWKLGSFHEAAERGFLNLGPRPVAFRVKIKAPDPGDAGQIICLFQKVQEVAIMIRWGATYPHRVNIKFTDGEKGKWFIDGKPTTTNLDGKPFCGYRYMLRPFFQLRNIRHAKVKIPKGVNPGSSDLKILRRVQLVMMETVSSSEYIECVWPTRFRIAQDNFYCDKAIARLNGWTAMMLRLENFVNRYVGEGLISKDLEERMEGVLKEGQVQGEQRYLPWTIQDDAMIRRLGDDFDSRER